MLRGLLRLCMCLLILLGPLAHCPVEGQCLLSPCPNMFSYGFKPGTNQLYGYIELRGLHISQFIKLSINLTISIPASEGLFGKLRPVKSDEETIHDISINQPVQYYFEFPHHDIIPNVLYINVNDQTICTGWKATGNVTELYLEYTIPVSVATRKQTQQRPIVDYSSNVDKLGIECGQPVQIFNSLSINGIRSPKGQFPWAAPIFDNRVNLKPKYICGSTIISTQHLVTAAHCMYQTTTGVPRQADDLITVPGMYNIDDFFNADLQERKVSTITIHDRYYFEASGLVESDIAVIKVDQPIVYNDVVRPICLWTESDNLEQIIGMKGFVSGWGVTEKGDAKYPNYVTATVVDRRSCSRNLEKLISDSAPLFCTDGHGSVPCTGDSGSGFVIQRGTKYYLRGIVSFGQFDPVTLTCAVNKYVLYTDVAPFRYWLSKVIKT